MILSIIAAIVESIGITTVLALFPFIISDDTYQGSTILHNSLYSMFAFVGIDLTPLSLVIFIIFTFLIKGVLNFATFGLNAYLRSKLMVKLKSELITHVSSMDYQYFIKKESGSFVNLINEQVAKSLNCFYHLCHLIGQAGNTIIYIIFGLATSLIFGIMSGVTGLVLLLLFKKLNRQVQIASIQTAHQNGKLSSQTVDLVQNLKYFKLLKSSSFLNAEISKSIFKLGRNQMKSGIAIALSQSLREPIIFVFVIMGFAISHTIFSISIEVALVSILFFYRALNSILGVQGNYQQFLENIGSLNLLKDELLSYHQSKTVIDQNKEIIKHDHDAEYCIEFDNVSFNYRSKDNIIFKNPLNFKIKTNQHIAFVGKSGEGKTTILDLICGVIKPIEGQIKWYGLAHQPDQTDITFGYISQEFSVFNGTVRQNITLGESDDTVSNDWLDVCIEAVSLKDMVASLPEKLDTPLGDRGLSLSGGQRQRLVIARELYKKPDILLMDEATSALDNATEKLVRHSIQKLHGKVTVIIVAHRVQTLEYVDQIFVLNKGQIVETGSYQDLRNDDDTYFNQIFPKILSDKKE